MSILTFLPHFAPKVGISPELICPGSKQKKYSEARALVAYMAVEELWHSAAEVVRYLESNGIMSFVQQKRGVKSVINSTTRGLFKELRFE